MKQENLGKRRCIDCNREIDLKRKVNKCSNCQTKSYWKQKYEELKAEFERHKVLCNKVQLDLWKRLKKHEPELTWDEEPD